MRRSLPFVTAAVFLFSLTSKAFIFTPMVKRFEPKGKERVQTFYLENKTDVRMAVQLSVYKRGVDEKGGESREPTGLLTVFPEQVVLDQGQKRTVRVTWNGAEKVEVEESFRLVAEQMPVDLKKNKAKETGISFLMKYVASIYILPEEVEPKVVLIDRQQIKKGKERRLSMTLKNVGNAHQVLNTMWIDFKREGGKGYGKKVRLEAKDVKDLVSINLLPGVQQNFVFPWPGNIPLEATDIEIGFNSGK